MGETINYGAKIVCFLASMMGETDLPGIETSAISSAGPSAKWFLVSHYFFNFSSLTSVDLTQPTRPF